MKKLLVLLFIVGFSSLGFASEDEEYGEGMEYLKLEKPVPTTTGDKVEVRELFWYGCPHCYNLEPMVNNWLKTKSDKADFIRQPAIFSKSWALDAVKYYTLEELGLSDKLHEVLFDRIHAKNKRFRNTDDFATWVASFGVDKDKVLKTIKSFGMRMKVNKSAVTTAKYRISGVPAFVVDGQYVTDASHAGGQNEMFKVVDFLIEKVSKKQVK